MRLPALVGGLATRRALLHLAALPLLWREEAAVGYELSTSDPLFGRLRCRYILMRPGETAFEAADIMDSNPINKGIAERGLTDRGRAQVERSAQALKERGVSTPIVFYDNGIRASQTADIISSVLSVPRAKMEPEFRWLEARGLGALDGTNYRKTLERMRALDALDIDNTVEPSDDGTPSDSVNEVFGRMRNTISKIETTYGAGDFVIIGGDATVLSILAAAACNVDLREHARFWLPPGAFWDLREVQRDWRSGTFQEMALDEPSAEDVRRGQQALRDIGPRLFSETVAGSWVLGPGVRR